VDIVNVMNADTASRRVFLCMVFHPCCECW
jgi:hypothetical protein